MSVESLKKTAAYRDGARKAIAMNLAAKAAKAKGVKRDTLFEAARASLRVPDRYAGAARGSIPDRIPLGVDTPDRLTREDLRHMGLLSY